MVASDLDFPLLEFPFKNSSPSYWTVRHAVEGVQIFGGIGSGKTSGSGRTIALKYLAAGFGGLVLTAKPDEKQLWQEYCRIANRTNDLIILEPESHHSFNFMDYESANAEGGRAITENIVEVLKTVIRAGEDQKGGKSDDSFWEAALDMLLFNVIDLCQLAYEKVSVERMYEIVQSIPKKQPDEKQPERTERTAFEKANEAAYNKVAIQVRAWEETLSEEMQELCRDPDFLNEEAAKAIPDARLLGYVQHFFAETYGTLSDRTRSIIDFSFSGFLYRLLREPIYSLFCKNKSTVTPDASLEGKIILLNLPVKVYQKVGRDCHILFKYIWQRTMERRDVNRNGRPVFLWADEAQNFLHEHDAVYQATARSSRIATVYISQNLPNYYASMGGAKFEHRVKSFLGTLGTKIFHANADIETNNYASELIGDGAHEDVTRTVNVGKEHSESQNVSVKFDRKVRPFQFVSLATGGPVNNLRVEGYMHRQGDALFAGENFKKMIFNQQFKPS